MRNNQSEKIIMSKDGRQLAFAEYGKPVFYFSGGNSSRLEGEAMGRYLAEQLPHSTLKAVESGGHFSTINNHIDEILDYLTNQT